MSLVKYVGSIVFLNFMSMNYLNLIDWFILFIVCKSSSYLENKSQHAIILWVSFIRLLFQFPPLKYTDFYTDFVRVEAAIIQV